MAYEVRVSTGDVAAKAHMVTVGAGEIEARLAQLTGQMADLAHTWTGAAGASFQALYADWDRTARETKTALDSIGLSLQGAGRSYDELEQHLAAAFS